MRPWPTTTTTATRSTPKSRRSGDSSRSWRRRPRRRSSRSSLRQGRPMPRTIRFHLDENCDPAIARGLRVHGVDVTTTPEAGLLSAEDEEHIAYGVATGRVAFTQDEDFLRL